MVDSTTQAKSQRLKTRQVNTVVLKFFGILAFLSLFILSITLMGAGFKLLGKEFAETLFTATANPLMGLAIGILATSIIQSSSTTTSIIVGLVASGQLPFEAAIPMVMGANIGTSVTNMIVSLAHLSRKEEFRRAFAGSTVHDFFNVCTVVVLLPLQIVFDVIGRSASVVESFVGGQSGIEFHSPLKAITKPVAGWLSGLMGDIGPLIIIVALILLFVALRYIVKLLKSLVLSRVERFFNRFVFRNGALAFGVGMVLTMLVQSSSVTTSLAVPLMGAGIITVVQVFPYTLGANIGTTITAFLAALTTGSHEAVSIAFAHLIFNIYGIAIFWPAKRIPIWLAETLAEFTLRSKLIPIVYIIIVFFLLPGLILLLE